MAIFGIKTIENKQLADLEGDFICIPWNPTYLNQLTLISTLIPGFDEEMILKEITVPTDLAGIFTFLQQMVLFDGLPTFLPCKMIMQNPNIDPVMPSRIIRKI